MISAIDVIADIVEEKGFSERECREVREGKYGEPPHPFDYIDEEHEGRVFRKYKHAVSIVTGKLVTILVIVGQDGESCEIHECSTTTWDRTIPVDFREDDLEKELLDSIEANS